MQLQTEDFGAWRIMSASLPYLTWVALYFEAMRSQKAAGRLQKGLLAYGPLRTTSMQTRFIDVELVVMDITSSSRKLQHNYQFLDFSWSSFTLPFSTRLRKHFLPKRPKEQRKAEWRTKELGMRHISFVVVASLERLFTGKALGMLSVQAVFSYFSKWTSEVLAFFWWFFNLFRSWYFENPSQKHHNQTNQHSTAWNHRKRPQNHQHFPSIQWTSGRVEGGFRRTYGACLDACGSLEKGWVEVGKPMPLAGAFLVILGNFWPRVFFLRHFQQIQDVGAYITINSVLCFLEAL